MKFYKKAALVMASAMLVMSLVGCGSEKNTYKIGVLQYADHPSLDNCTDGFIAGLTEMGIDADVVPQSAKGDDSTNTQIAQQMVSQGVDLICGVATPSAQACYNAAYEAGIPVIFNAVSDPVEAKLAKSATETMDGITGVSDKLPVEAQLKLIREILPDAKKIGILYTTSETNSVSTLADYKAKAGEYGFEIVERGITNAAEIPQAADLLLSEVDCITNMTDNTVVNNLPILIEKANAAKIPVFGSEEEQVGNGCVASAGIDYLELGRKAGIMAARVLKGEDISQIPYETITESKVTINPDAAKIIGLSIPKTVTERAEIMTKGTGE